MSFSLPQELQEIARVGRVREDPREDVRVGVGVVEFQLYTRVECHVNDVARSSLVVG